jgi:hypothetical protein
MTVRKFLFAVSAVALLFGGSVLAEKASRRPVPQPKSVADGADPVPLPYPKPPRSGIVGNANVLPGSGILVADGADPVPLPYPRRLA